MNGSRRRQALGRIACMALLMAAAGCYESTEPLGPAEGGSVDPSLVGVWRCENPSDPKAEVAHLVAMPFDRTQYYLEWRDEDSVKRYRAFTTQLKEGSVFNVIGIAPDASAAKWVFLRAARAGDGVLSLSIVKHEALKDPDPPAALKEIARRVSDDSLYRPWAVCTLESRAKR